MVRLMIFNFITFMTVDRDRVHEQSKCIPLGALFHRNLHDLDLGAEGVVAQHHATLPSRRP